MIELNAMETLQISPNILRWAAEQRGLSLDALVDLLDKPAKHDVLIASTGQLIKQLPMPVISKKRPMAAVLTEATLLEIASD